MVSEGCNGQSLNPVAEVFDKVFDSGGCTRVAKHLLGEAPSPTPVLLVRKRDEAVAARNVQAESVDAAHELRKVVLVDGCKVCIARHEIRTAP